MTSQENQCKSCNENYVEITHFVRPGIWGQKDPYCSFQFDGSHACLFFNLVLDFARPNLCIIID